ncbi:unnamed protein product [Jaminaea pallidilutea]
MSSTHPVPDSSSFKPVCRRQRSASLRRTRRIYPMQLLRMLQGRGRRTTWVCDHTRVCDSEDGLGELGDWSTTMIIDTSTTTISSSYSGGSWLLLVL